MQLFEAFVQLIGEAPAERQHTQFVLQLKELELLKASAHLSCLTCSPRLQCHRLQQTAQHSTSLWGSRASCF